MRRDVLAALALVGLAAGAAMVWPDEPPLPAVPGLTPETSAPGTWAGSHSPFAATAPASLPVPPAPAAVPRAVLSREVAPGVHVTPLGVPPGTTPRPAGPGPDDSEPEN